MKNQSCDSGNSETVCEEPTRIFFETPEDMLNPLAINPSFVPIVLTHSIIFFIGIVGNTVVIVTWAGSKPARSPTCTFLVSLAVADLILLVFYVPLELVGYFVITWDAGGTICKLSSYIEMLSGMASVLNLTAVSIERFLVIAYPIMARRFCTVSTCRRGLCIVWGLAIALALPVCFTKRIYPITYFNNQTSITAYYCFDSTDSMAFMVAIYQLVAMFIVPAFFMMLCYICVIRELWSSTRTVAAMTRPTDKREIMPAIQDLQLSENTVTRRIGAISKDMQTQLKSDLKICEWFSLQFDESTDIADTAQLAVRLRMKLSSITADEALAMVGNMNGFIALCIKDGSFPDFMSYHCMSTRKLSVLLFLCRYDSDRELHNSRHCLLRFNWGRRQQRATPERILSIHRQGLEIQHARKQVIKMLILVIILFLMCWGPRLIMHVIIKHGLNSFTDHIYNLRVATYLLSFAHSAINPIIYGFMSTNFRKMMLQCCKDSICNRTTCTVCRHSSSCVIEELPQRRNLSDSYEFSTLTTSTRRSRQANSINVEDPRFRRSEEQWTAV
nr:cholecystokinin receptor type A-like [Parasteatoda tepidariorum]